MKKSLFASGFVITLSLSTLSVVAQTQSRVDILKQIEAKRAELAALEKQFLAPSDEDRAAYADFLRKPDTGLIRLLPRETYDSDTFKNNNRQKAITIRGGAAYYSFARLTHEYGYGSDIELSQGFLTSGFTGGQRASLIDLGDIPLESVTLENGAVQDLVRFDANDRKPSQARLPLKYSTYAVRSIDYSSSDVLVAFKVVRIDTDGSAIILWKMLQRGPVPETLRIR
jgi:hypothetical protein